MLETAVQGPSAAKLRRASEARTSLNDAAWYYDVLRPHASKVEVWRTVYHHPLTGGVAAVVEWFKGSGLRPFLDPLDPAERSAYLERYTAAIAPFFRERRDGSVLLPFPRLFMVAVR
jgi:trans-aconitate 2-methyltransferase